MSALDSCMYCGEAATLFDHAIPRLYCGRTASRTTHAGNEPGLKVPCCNECNVILGSRIFKNLVERKRFVHHRLLVRLQKYSNHVEWDTEEMGVLGKNLHHTVDAFMAKQIIARDRITYSAGPPEPIFLKIEEKWRQQHGDTDDCNVIE